MLFVACESNPTADVQKETPTKDTTIIQQIPAAEPTPQQDCFQTLFERMLNEQRYTVKKDEYEQLTRSGLILCFLQQNESDFAALEKHTKISMHDPTEMEHPVLVNQLVFPDERRATILFDKLDRGYHNNCLGMKEPNFLIQENNQVYIFFVDAEYYRSVLEAFQAALDEELKACKNLRLGAC